MLPSRAKWWKHLTRKTRKLKELEHLESLELLEPLEKLAPLERQRWTTPCGIIQRFCVLVHWVQLSKAFMLLLIPKVVAQWGAPHGSALCR